MLVGYAFFVFIMALILGTQEKALPSWGVPSAQCGDKNQKWVHHPCRLGGAQNSTREGKSEMTTWPTFGQRGFLFER